MEADKEFYTLARIAEPPPGADTSAGRRVKPGDRKGRPYISRCLIKLDRALRMSAIAVRAVTMDSPYAYKRRKRPLDQSLGHDVPVRTVEELLLHVVVQAGTWWMRRVLIVEDELGGPALPCLYSGVTKD